MGTRIPVWKVQSERITRKRRLVLDEDVRAALCPASSRELENKERERESSTHHVIKKEREERERERGREPLTTNVG